MRVERWEMTKITGPFSHYADSHKTESLTDVLLFKATFLRKTEICFPKLHHAQDFHCFNLWCLIDPYCSGESRDTNKESYIKYLFLTCFNGVMANKRHPFLCSCNFTLSASMVWLTMQRI